MNNKTHLDMQKIGTIFILIALLFTTKAFAENPENDDPPKKETSTVEKVVAWYMDNMNYGTILLLMTVESSFIPFPSEVIVPPAAYKASREDSGMNIVLVVLFATLGALLGAIINYYLALWLGRPIVYRFAESKIGKMCLLNKEKVIRAENYFTRHGKSSTLIGRLVPAVRQLISIPAGLSKMHIGNFLLFTGIGALTWNIVLAILGYIAHGQSDMIDKYNKELSYALLGLGTLFVCYLVYNGFFKKKK